MERKLADGSRLGRKEKEPACSFMMAFFARVAVAHNRHQGQTQARILLFSLQAEAQVQSTLERGKCPFLCFLLSSGLTSAIELFFSICFYLFFDSIPIPTLTQLSSPSSVHRVSHAASHDQFADRHNRISANPEQSPARNLGGKRIKHPSARFQGFVHETRQRPMKSCERALAS
jgi:hypothetical protein